MSASVRTEGLLVVCDLCESHYVFPVKYTTDGVVFDPARDVSGWEWIGVVAEAVPDVKTAPIVAKLACPDCVEARTMRKPRRFRERYEGCGIGGSRAVDVAT